MFATPFFVLLQFYALDKKIICKIENIIPKCKQNLEDNKWDGCTFIHNCISAKLICMLCSRNYKLYTSLVNT